MEPTDVQSMHDAPENKKTDNGFWGTVRFAAISLIIVFTIRYFIAQPFIVSGDSMVPTFENGEYLIVDELSYRFEPPERGDVIILRYPLDPKKYFIKRIVGLPGETLSFDGSVITITPTNGHAPFVFSEPYVKNEGQDFISVTLHDNEYYVLGDNRAASSDSRRWGALPKDDIVGRPIIRLFPLSKIDWLPGTSLEIQQ